MFNNTSVEFETNTTFPKIEGPSIIVSLVIGFLVFWIIAVNLVVLTCLFISKHGLKNFVNLQILSFSIIDTIVGLTSILLVFRFPFMKAIPYFETCAVLFYSYSTAQSASVYHAFGICVHRLITIKRKITGRKEPNSKQMYKVILLQVSLTWIICMIISSIPFIVYG